MIDHRLVMMLLGGGLIGLSTYVAGWRIGPTILLVAGTTFMALSVITLP